MNDAETEKLLDARVQRRLATDRAYKHAENAEEQSEREDEIEREEAERLGITPEDAVPMVANTVAMVAVDMIERDHRATIAKIETLAKDALHRASEASSEGSVGNHAYWLGYESGLRRSIRTIEGRDHSPS